MKRLSSSMRSVAFGLPFLLWSLLAGGEAQAAITCSLSAPMVNYAYVVRSGAATVSAVQQGSVNASCTRTSASDPTSLTLEINDGLNKIAGTNNARLTVSGVHYNLSYDFFRDGSCSSVWGKTGNAINATVSSTALNTPVPVSFNYWVCMNSGQLTTASPSGTYTDSAVITLSTSSPGKTTLATSSMSVNMFAPATCAITRAPAQILFAYAAFSASPAFAGTNFEASCTNYLPYTMSISPASGVVAGLRYTLGLSLASADNAASNGPVSLQTVGNATGKATHYINGSMAAAQAGEVGPIVPQTHTLTITY